MSKSFSRLFAVFALLGVVSALAVAAGPRNVTICHWSPDEGRFVTISVSPNALEAHFTNHGDSTPGS